MHLLLDIWESPSRLNRWRTARNRFTAMGPSTALSQKTRKCFPHRNDPENGGPRGFCCDLRLSSLDLQLTALQSVLSILEHAIRAARLRWAWARDGVQKRGQETHLDRSVRRNLERGREREKHRISCPPIVGVCIIYVDSRHL